MVGQPPPRVKPDLDLLHAPDGPPSLTWIGHSTFFGRLGDTRFLIDPVFSSRVGVIYPRQSAPGIAVRDLPRPDVVLVSHNHYDHLDRPILRHFDRVPVVAPAGNARLIPRAQRVIELEWWQSAEVGSLRVTLVPARHWSRRSILDTNRSLWGGFVIEWRGRSVYHAGDSAVFDGFSEIGRRFPGLEAAMLPIGGYDPPWFMEHNHMNPEQAGEAFLATGARLMLPMHWGDYRLTDEPLDEPPRRLTAWWDATRPANRRLKIPALGETVSLDAEEDPDGGPRES